MPRRLFPFLLSILIASPCVFAGSFKPFGQVVDELWDRGTHWPRFDVTSYEYREVRKVIEAWLSKPATPADHQRRLRMRIALLTQIASFKRMYDREDLERYLQMLAKTYLNRMTLLDKSLSNEGAASLLRADILRLATESYFTALTSQPEPAEYKLYLEHYHHRLMQGAYATVLGAGLIWQSGYHAHPYALLATAVLPVVAGVMKLLDLRRLSLRQPMRHKMARVHDWLNRRWMKLNDVDLMSPSGHRKIDFTAAQMRDACDHFLAIDRSSREVTSEP